MRHLATALCISSLALLGAGSCKSSDDSRDTTSRVSTAINIPTGTSASELENTSSMFFRVFNRAFVTSVSELPTRGSVPTEKLPYSGFQYPENRGGTNIRWNNAPSALEKYDAVFNKGQPLAVAWEKEKHTDTTNSRETAWYGHCNGWSAAAIRHAEPRLRVKRLRPDGSALYFEPQDIKALLAEIYMNTDYFPIGGVKCQASAPIRPSERVNPEEMGACQDINPATLHLALGNWVGKLGHAIIMDRSSNNEVWNHPIHAYSFKMNEITRDQAIQRIWGYDTSAPRPTEYTFNKRAVRFYYVETAITYTDGLMDAEALGNVAPKHVDATFPQPLRYILEVDANEQIIGGEWSFESQIDHPDFLWASFEPIQPNGTRSMGNLYVKNAEVMRLWAESIGADPLNPPTDIKSPASASLWGHFADYDVLLDGLSTGAAFLGKPIELEFRRGERLTGDINIAISLNGQAPVNLTARGGSHPRQVITPQPGINSLRFLWSRGGVTLADDRLLFHAVR
jgi:hypothetical protein